MFDGSIHSRGGEGEYCCEFESTLKGEYCGQRGQFRLNGLLLCESHTRQLRLEERVVYWRAILAHIELWSREARTRGREDIVDLLGIERTKASAALRRILLEDMERSEGRGEGDGASGDGRDGNGKGADGKDGEGGDGRVIPLWPPLLLVLFLSLAVRGYAL
jgi:hypothetical protein